MQNNLIHKKGRIKANAFRLVNFSAFLLVFIFLISFSSAAPPAFQQSDSTIGVEIETPVIVTHLYNQDFKFHLHAYNATNGTIFTNESISCMIHLYNPITGGHLIEDNMSFDSNGVDFEYTVTAGNFTTIGQYAVLFDCHGLGIGGFFEYGFDVVPSEQVMSSQFWFIIIILVYAIAFIGFFGRNEIVTIIGGMLMLILGLFIIQNGIVDVRATITTAIAYTTIAIGAFFSLKAVMELIEG